MNLITDSETIKQNNIKFELMNNTGIKKRIMREFELLYQNYNTILTFIDTNPSGYNSVNVDVSEKINGKKYSYTFKISHNYPFVPPAIYLNNIPYSEFLRIQNSYEQNMIKNITGAPCFCCTSFLCRDNWSPAVTINKIMDQIKYIKSCKRDIVNKIFADKIKIKYLINDIDLDSFLFAKKIIRI